jgi:hypothetical protein
MLPCFLYTVVYCGYGVFHFAKCHYLFICMMGINEIDIGKNLQKPNSELLNIMELTLIKIALILICIFSSFTYAFLKYLHIILHYIHTVAHKKRRCCICPLLYTLLIRTGQDNL